MFEREYRELSFVPRWTIVRTLRRQSVAEHSYYVTLYAGQIADMVEWKGNRANLLDYALRHDLEEGYMSDIPGPSKRKIVMKDKYHTISEQGNINLYGEDYKNHSGMFSHSNDLPEIKAIVKVADLLDECFFLATEMQLGNKSLDNVMHNSRLRLWEAVRALPNTNMGTHEVIRNAFVHALDNHENRQSCVPTVP